MAALVNCKVCNRLFISKGSSICDSCSNENKDVYERIKEYIERHPNSTIMDISNVLDIPAKKVLDLVRSEQFQLR
ncbi:MAG: hypothetical protein HPY66_2405 [Firmicutes bacterium]|nr:hypothetical protein [Bacillota bacterium]MDI6707032.1 hypothetical protein [Bacillota bacterium]